MVISYPSGNRKRFSLKKVLSVVLVVPIVVLICIEVCFLAFLYGRDYYRSHQKSPFSFPGTTWCSSSPKIELEIPEGTESCFIKTSNCYEAHCTLFRGEEALDAVVIIYEGDNYIYFFDGQKKYGENKLFYGRYYYRHGNVLIKVYHYPTDTWWEQYNTIILYEMRDDSHVQNG